MQVKNRRAHWQYMYAAKGECEVSWFQDDAQPSLALIEEVGSPSSTVIDIGGGASRLADLLLQRGFLDLTILDLSSAALAAAACRNYCTRKSTSRPRSAWSRTWRRRSADR